jgi:hypothetical protein
MKRYRKLPATVTLICASISLSDHAIALDLNGAWASDADNCPKVFTRKGSQMAFSDNFDVYGSGFIIEGDQIIGKSGRCRIRARKDNGAYINLIAACASDIISQSMQFSLKEVDANTITRVFPGMDGMEINFTRCPAQ